MDIDLGLALAILGGQRYQDLSARLRGAGFSPDVNNAINPNTSVGTRPRRRRGIPRYVAGHHHPQSVVGRSSSTRRAKARRCAGSTDQQAMMAPSARCTHS